MEPNKTQETTAARINCEPPGRRRRAHSLCSRLVPRRPAAAALDGDPTQQLPGRRVAGTGHVQEGVLRAEPHRRGAEDTSHARRRPAADLGRGALPRVFEREGGRPQTARSLAGEAERVLRGAAFECSAGRELGAVRGVVENVSGPAARGCGLTHRGRPVVRRRGLLRRGALSGRAQVRPIKRRRRLPGRRTGAARHVAGSKCGGLGAPRHVDGPQRNEGRDLRRGRGLPPAS